MKSLRNNMKTMKRNWRVILCIVVTVIVVAAIAIPQVIMNSETHENYKPIQYSSEVKQGIINEAYRILETRGLTSKVAGLGYEAGNINLLFYGKSDAEAVIIVQSVIDKKAPGMPLIIYENVTTEYQK
jgi:vancomycin permeability regulator SanA